MVDYLLVKRNNHIFVVVYQGTVRPCRDCSWCKKYKLPGTHVAELKLCEVSVSLFLAIHFYQKLIRGWNVQLSFNAREYSHLPYLETLVTDVHFQQMAAARSSCRCFKTRVLHFSVKNAPLKDKKWKEKVQKNTQLSFCGAREAFHREIVLRGIQPCFLHDGAHGLFWNATKAVKFLLYFQVHFALYGQENYVFERKFMYF